MRSTSDEQSASSSSMIATNGLFTARNPTKCPNSSRRPEVKPVYPPLLECDRHVRFEVLLNEGEQTFIASWRTSHNALRSQQCGMSLCVYACSLTISRL